MGRKQTHLEEDAEDDRDLSNATASTIATRASPATMMTRDMVTDGCFTHDARYTRKGEVVGTG
jgi:hypothetical protein